MKTFKEMTEQEIKEVTLQQESAIKEYKSTHKINNVLIIGVGLYCNRAISKINRHNNITKLFIDTNSKRLKEFSDYPNIDLSEEKISDDKDLWKTDYKNKKIFNEISKFQVYFTNYDYIVICTVTDDEEYNLVTEILADFIKQQNKRFMICHTKTYLSYVAGISGIKKFSEISNNFLAKMKEKKYITNEINNVSTSLLYDVVSFKSQNENYKTNLATKSDSRKYEEINSDIFAKIVENSIIKMLEE